MNKFEVVSAYADKGINIPTRATHAAAGYDFEVAEDIVVPSMEKLWYKALSFSYEHHAKTLEEMAKFTKAEKVKPTLVPTGVKCQLASDHYLELSVRSSTPLKHWLILANGVGIIDGDYYNNPDNEGHIYFQLINLSPFDSQLKKGDKIGQGIIKKYEVTDDDYKYKKKERAGGFGSTSPIAKSFHGETASVQMTMDDLLTTSMAEDTAISNSAPTTTLNDLSKRVQEIQDNLYHSLRGVTIRG